MWFRCPRSLRTMIRLNRPDPASIARAAIHRHQQVVRCPVLRVTVWSVNPKYQDEAIAFAMDARAGIADVAVFECSVAAPVGVDLAVSLQAGQPQPAEGSQQFEVFQTAVPVIETDIVLSDFLPFVVDPPRFYPPER